MDSKLEQDYKLVRLMVVRGELTSADAKLWLKGLETKHLHAMQARLKRFGTNVNRENKDMVFSSGSGDE